MRKITFFDVETTGLDPAQDQIISYALQHWALQDDGSIYRGEVLSRLVLPAVEVHPRAAQVNGYTEEAWIAQGAQPFSLQDVELISNYCAFSAGRYGPVLGGHNVGFDISFLTWEFHRLGYPFKVSNHHLDTMALAHPLATLGVIPNVKLESLRIYLGLPLDNAHQAGDDLAATIYVWEQLLKLYQAGLAGP